MQRIILLGYMGAGKTTIGRVLAKHLKLKFYDLDLYIEARMHKSIEDIFNQSGEETFRKIEYNMLHEVAEFENTVISLGGGTPCFFNNMEYINQQAETVFLNANTDVIIKHLEMSKKIRPLLKNKTLQDKINTINTQLKNRIKYYNKAKHVVNIEVLDSIEKITNTVKLITTQLNTI